MARIKQHVGYTFRLSEQDGDSFQFGRVDLEIEIDTEIPFATQMNDDSLSAEKPDIDMLFNHIVHKIDGQIDTMLDGE